LEAAVDGQLVGSIRPLTFEKLKTGIFGRISGSVFLRHEKGGAMPVESRFLLGNGRP